VKGLVARFLALLRMTWLGGHIVKYTNVMPSSLERGQREKQLLRGEVEKGWDNFVGRSAVIQQQYELIRQVAGSNTSVLITGESGTGKELVAHAIHHASPRREALFVPINCAAIPVQAKLFRVLQENVLERLGSNRSVPIDIRIIATTNQDVRRVIQQGALTGASTAS
jgi:two-component system response regulator AtoC